MRKAQSSLRGSTFREEHSSLTIAAPMALSKSQNAWECRRSTAADPEPISLDESVRKRLGSAE